ncbi:methyltransferase [Nocardiopsis sp. RSe5-2]|uniref:Methyltransferase n=1 Tax=Nocardiopsis endophytica TaxID=3018445 RepID=A0ABT4U7Q0_9ACTN|nr:methyltransferase [Nocardiopsis endophytica]MDA2812988.1 methyltransferase [Nocardiopsis endophytica]
MHERSAPASEAGAGPGRILELAMAFYGSRARMAAVELDLFTRVARGPATADELCADLGIHPRGGEDFLDALVALDLLEREDGRYRCTPESAAHLDAAAPGYVGGYARLADAALYPLWGRLTEALRTGRPQVPEDPAFLQGYRDPDLADRFMGAMDAVNAEAARAIAAGLDWSGVEVVADFGGARGNLAAGLVRAHPHLKAVCVDLPETAPLFERHMDRLGTTGQVAFHAADLLADPLPRADAVVLGHMLHYFGDGDRTELLRRAAGAVGPSGAVLVYDRMIGGDRRGPALSLLGSLNMLLSSDGGREYTVDECRGWMEEAGLRVERVGPAGPLDTLVVARPRAAGDAGAEGGAR